MKEIEKMIYYQIVIFLQIQIGQNFKNIKDMKDMENMSTNILNLNLRQYIKNIEVQSSKIKEFLFT